MEKKNTALQELIEWFNTTDSGDINMRTLRVKVKSLLPKEKADIVDAYAQGAQDSGVKAEPENKEFFFNQTFNQTP